MCAVVHELERQIGVGHHCTAAYAPWSDGTVDGVNRDVLALTLIMLSDTHLPTDEWPAFVPNLVSVLNVQPSTRRGGLAAITAFCGFLILSLLETVLSTGA
jgi:hypothetical protein